MQLKSNKEKDILEELHRIENLINDYDGRISELTGFADGTEHDVRVILGIAKEFDKKLDDIKRI